MTKPKQILSPTIIKYCQRCSDDERKAIVAYCCYLSYADRSIRRWEVDIVRAIADEMGITPEATAKMARKVRKNRLKIKKPKSRSARKLLFHLALRLAVADNRLDSRERSAIDKLAEQLRISDEIVENELQRVQSTPPADDPLSILKNVTAQSDQPEKDVQRPLAESPKRTLTSVVESLSRDWVEEDLEADLFPYPKQPDAHRKGEVEYSLTMNGNAELEIELDDIDVPTNETLSLIIAGKPVSEIVVPSGRIEHRMRAQDNDPIPKVTRGDSAEIQHRGKAILTGTFEPN